MESVHRVKGKGKRVEKELNSRKAECLGSRTMKEGENSADARHGKGRSIFMGVTGLEVEEITRAYKK